MSIRMLAACSLLLAACASAPRSEPRDREVLHGYTVEQVREAARGVLEQLAYGQWDVRVHDHRVLTEGRIGRCDEHVDCGHGTRLEEQTLGSPWSTLEVRFRNLGSPLDVEVAAKIEYREHSQSCRYEVDCIPERFGSTGVLERDIVDRIRARLEEETDVAPIL